MSFVMQLTNFQNVAPGNIATLKVPTGANAPTCDKINIELMGGLQVSHIKKITGKANGRLFYEERGGLLANLRHAYKNRHTAVDVLSLDFTEPNARNGAVEQMLATIPLSQLQDLQFEFELADDAPAGSKVKAEMHYRQPTQNPYIAKLLNTTETFNGSGDQIMWLPTGGAGGKVRRIWVHESDPGAIEAFEIRVGNTTAYETNRKRLEHNQKQNNLVPQNGVVVIDFVADGNLSGLMDTGTAKNIELRMLTTKGATFNVYYDLIDPIGRL